MFISAYNRVVAALLALLAAPGVALAQVMVSTEAVGTQYTNIGTALAAVGAMVLIATGIIVAYRYVRRMIR